MANNQRGEFRRAHQAALELFIIIVPVLTGKQDNTPPLVSVFWHRHRVHLVKSCSHDAPSLSEKLDGIITYIQDDLFYILSAK